MSAVATVVCLLALATLALAGGSERLSNGHNANPGQFPFMVSFRLQTNRHLCGGAIITQRHVLTAAHCVVHNLNPALYIVAVGAHTLEDGERHNLIRITVHQNFQPSSRLNDISVLTTATTIQYNNLVSRVLLPRIDLDDNIRTLVFLSGFGTELVHNGAPAVLRWQQTRTLPRPACRTWLNSVAGPAFVQLLHESSVCALGASGQGAATGDNGGPLVDSNGVLIGLVSVGFSGRGAPDIFVRVFPQLNFIFTVMSTPI